MTDCLNKYFKNTSYKWLITGAAGFIGSNIVEELLLNDQRVIALDNFSTGNIENLNTIKENITSQQWEKLELIKGCITDKNLCDQISNGIDYVIHHAALSSVQTSINNPVLTHSYNVDGTFNIFNAARNSNVKRVIYASSASIYGDMHRPPILETMSPTPLSPYATTKIINEFYADSFSKNYSLEIIGLRYFNVFGPNQKPNGEYGSVIPSWISSLLNNKELTIFGDGSTTRDFIFIKNIVFSNIIAALSKSYCGGHNVYNLGLGKPVSLSELESKLRELIPSQSKTIYNDFRTGDILHSHSCTKKFSDTFDYTPSTDIFEGLRQTVNWYKNTLQ